MVLPNFHPQIGYRKVRNLRIDVNKLVGKVSINLPHIWNHPQKKKFANFTNLETFTNVILHFLSQPEFLYMSLPESPKVSCELWQRSNLQNFSSTDDSRYTVLRHAKFITSRKVSCLCSQHNYPCMHLLVKLSKLYT